ncbi:MAG TPA: hypothetical protein VFB04_17055 [Terriglobales bacterium]|nr:hypothetical protein [Terriglobales bacterium]
MVSLWPSTINSLNDSLAALHGSLGKIKAARSVDISEVIEQLKSAAESSRNLRALVLSELPEASWQNREELDAIVEEISKRIEARNLEQRRFRLLSLATQLERGTIVHRRTVRLNQLQQLRDQATKELRSQAALAQPPALPGPESDEWIDWACKLKEPEDADSLQSLRNGFARLDEFIANLEPDMWTIKKETTA